MPEAFYISSKSAWSCLILPFGRYMGVKMSAKSADKISHILALIAIFVVLYNAYLAWFENRPSFYLSIFLVILLFLSILAGEYRKNNNYE
jgi:glucose-6-phosphate-specific signal transduction histidine kinase